RPYLLKPNEHEARIITGLEVNDLDTARTAAQKLMAMGAQNVLITHGPQGAYLFAGGSEQHIPIPPDVEGPAKDPTGCGDQMMAVLSAYLQAGQSIEQAARAAVVAGTLEFHKAGCQPV